MMTITTSTDYSPNSACFLEVLLVLWAASPGHRPQIPQSLTRSTCFVKKTSACETTLNVFAVWLEWESHCARYTKHLRNNDKKRFSHAQECNKRNAVCIGTR